MEVSSRMSGSPTDILVSLLTPPVLPQVSMNSQIVETPTLVATDLIPRYGPQLFIVKCGIK